MIVRVLNANTNLIRSQAYRTQIHIPSVDLQSDTFAEGEKPESPPVVGERLSREGSPVPDEGEERMESPPVPGTPPHEEEEEEEEEYEEEQQYDRDQLIERYHVS